MRTKRISVPLAAVAALLLFLPALAAERVALVVGNADYDEAAAKLRNPVNDAAAVAAALRRMGFVVIEGTDLDRDGFFDKIIEFDDAAREAKIALFFYAGHGLQVDGRNYLGPVDMKLERKQDLSRRAIELGEVLEVMRSETNLVILDACRTNPLARGLARSLGLSRAVAVSRGLARVEKTRGMLIAFATAADDVAADGDGDHSPFTAALLEHLETPGLSVQELFTHVTASVEKSTGKKQSPWTNASLSKVVRLVPGDDPGPTVTVSGDEMNGDASDRLTAEQLAAERGFWESVKDSEDPADLRAYLEQYPEGTYKALASNRLRKLGEKRLASVDAGNLREMLGRELSANAVGEYGWTDLHYAAAANLPEVVEALIDAGANVAARAALTEDDDTPLSDTLRQFLEVLGFELKFWWPDPRPGSGLTPLHVAAWGNAREAALALIRRGADVEAMTEEGWTALHWAGFGNAREAALALIEHDADVQAQNKWGDTPLHFAASTNAMETTLTLISHGADIKAKGAVDRTPLHSAGVNNSLNVVLELIKRGAKIDAKASDDGTALHLAVWSGSREAALALIERGADVRAKDMSGETPLHDAAWSGIWEIVSALIERGADVHAENDAGETPLHFAARANALEIAHVLIKRGADREAKNQDGQMPLDLATQLGSQDVKEFLKKQSPAKTRAEELKEPKIFQDCPECPKMLVVPPGSFEMGAADWVEGSGNWSGPQHLVTIRKPFAVGVYEVTRGEYRRFVEETDHVTEIHPEYGCQHYDGDWHHPFNWHNPGYDQRDDHPVVCVGWHDAQAYVRWLSEKTEQDYRLLSEAEWEYVARRGTPEGDWLDVVIDQCRYENGADLTAKRDHEGWNVAFCEDGYTWTSPVGSYEKNGYGLHDVLGNVAEWIEDCWNDNYRGAPNNGSAWNRGECDRRIPRGGYWGERVTKWSVIGRGHGAWVGHGGDGTSFTGFRVARTLAP